MPFFTILMALEQRNVMAWISEYNIYQKWKSQISFPQNINMNDLIEFWLW